VFAASNGGFIRHSICLPQTLGREWRDDISVLLKRFGEELTKIRRILGLIAVITGGGIEYSFWC
jgi:hypothetical protein